MLKEKLINKEGFTETEKQLADFFLGKGEEAAYMTVREIAEPAIPRRQSSCVFARN